MPASWEIVNQNQVLVVILTREMVSSAWSAGFRNLQIPGTYTFLSGMPFGMARNVGCQKTLELGFQWCMFLDDDVIPPPDTIPRLMSHRQPIVTGVYYRRNPPINPVMLRNVPGGRQWITEFKTPDLMEIDYCGAGCLLIHSSVLSSLPPITPRNHWFEWRVDAYDLPAEQRMSEDFQFCEHARNHGYKVYADTSILCRHVGLGESRVNGEYVPTEIMC